MALRMVWETARTVRVPVIGMGGIGSAEDALEFILAGASAVAIGTANFTRPTAMHDTIAGLSRFLDDEGVGDLRELIGALRYEPFGAAAPVDVPSAYGPPDTTAGPDAAVPISQTPGGNHDE
jgi:tRNA-dihydrouridine synthase